MIFDGRGAPKAHIYKKPLPALRATLPKGEGFGTINPNLFSFRYEMRMLLRMALMAPFSSRETWAWEMPRAPATSIGVLPS